MPTPSSSAVPASGSSSIWATIFRDDFTQSAALGSWDPGYNANAIVYTGSTGTKWRTYPSNYYDTYQHRPYQPGQVLSVHDGVLDFWLHQVNGQPAGANPSPVITGSSQYQTYGQYSARMRVVGSMPSYHMAWLLWPQSEVWPRDGEIDWPEAQLDGSSPGGFLHSSSLGGCSGNCQQYAGAPNSVKLTDWHTYTIQWMPNHLVLKVDNTVVMDTTQAVPSTPMRWQLQTETNTNGPGTDSGNVQVDWVQVDRYVG